MKIEFPEIIEYKKEITKLFVSQNVERRHPDLWLQVTIQFILVHTLKIVPN